MAKDGHFLDNPRLLQKPKEYSQNPVQNFKRYKGQRRQNLGSRKTGPFWTTPGCSKSLQNTVKKLYRLLKGIKVKGKRILNSKKRVLFGQPTGSSKSLQNTVKNLQRLLQGIKVKGDRMGTMNQHELKLNKLTCSNVIGHQVRRAQDKIHYQMSGIYFQRQPVS